MNRRRLAAAALVAAVAVPAAGYVPSVAAILKRAGEKRSTLSLTALEATGTLEVQGDAAARLAQAVGVPPGAEGRLALPARFLFKVPGRCRLEMVRPGAAEADRPFLVVRDGRISGRGLDAIPAAAALARAACSLLAVPGGPESDRAYAQALARRGVALDASSFALLDDRIALVVGGTAREARPLAFFDKETAQPLRLLAKDGGALVDARLVGWGSPEGGDWFPRAIELWEGDALRARFATQKASANPRLPEALF